jgi:hypothetical protein
MRLLITLALLVSSAATLFSQASIHFDRPYHVAGEVSWFSVYPDGPTPPKVRVTVNAPDGRVMDYFFLNADANGQLNGYFRWPFEAITGYYSLVVDGIATDKKTYGLIKADHAVYSDARAEPSAGNPVSGVGLPAAGGLALSVNGGQVSISGLNGDTYSVSVINEDVVGDAGAGYVVGQQAPQQAPQQEWVDTLFYQGLLSLKNGEPVQTNLLPVFDPGTYRFDFTKSDDKGRFLLEMAAFEGAKEVQVRSVEGSEFHSTVNSVVLEANRATPPVTEAIAAYIDLARRRRKIYQLFATVETEVDASVTPQERRTLRPNRDFDVQDYKAFTKMYEFFKEVGGELRVKVRKESYSARLYNAPNQRFFQSSPLYIVDGKLTQNDNYINRMSPSDVSYLAYFYDNKQLRRDFPALGNNGVIQIETLRQPTDFPASDAAGIFTVKGLQPTATFQPRNAEDSGVPALSPLLMWETGGGEQTVTVTLPATDDFGKYKIVVVARDMDGVVRSVSGGFEREVK